MKEWETVTLCVKFQVSTINDGAAQWGSKLPFYKLWRIGKCQFNQYFDKFVTFFAVPLKLFLLFIPQQTTKHFESI